MSTNDIPLTLHCPHCLAIIARPASWFASQVNNCPNCGQAFRDPELARAVRDKQAAIEDQVRRAGVHDNQQRNVG